MNTQYGDTNMGLEQIGKFVMKAAAQKYSMNQQRKAQKASAAQARVQRQDVLVNKQSNNDPVYVQYGTHRMGGTRVFVESSDGSGNTSGTTKLNMVLVICEGQIHDIKKVYFNDTIVWDSTNGGTKVYNTTTNGWGLTGFISKYAPTITMNWYTGTTTTGNFPNYPGTLGSDQRYDRDLSTSVNTGNWNANHKLLGVCYCVLLLEANSEVYAGQLPTVTVEQTGKRLLNVDALTDGDTNPNSGDYTVQNYYQNPAEVLYDYLISDIYGKGLDRDENGNYIAGKDIDLASFRQAKSDCASARTKIVNGAITNLAYGIDGFLQTEKQLFDNVGEILETCNGMLLFIDGKYHLKIEKPNEHLGLPQSKIFTKENIIGEIQLSMPTKSTKLNKITGTFSNPATKYNDDVIIIDNPTYRLEDNGSVLETNADYTLITNADLVTDLLTQTLDKSRVTSTLTFTAAHTALELRSGDVIEVRHSEFGWGTGAGETQKFWRVVELKLTEDNTVEVSAVTYDSALEL